MGSTDLDTFLQYISNWETKTDEQIDCLISEQELFLKMDDFEFGPAVDEEFQILTDLAVEVRDMTIASDVMQIEKDVTAVASIWSFGLSTAIFALLEVDQALENGTISTKSNKLSTKLDTVDIDIASKINKDVQAYIEKFKENNRVISAGTAMEPQRCRSILMHFMVQVQRMSGKLNPSIFRQYAASARKIHNSKEITDIYDALDALNFSECNKADVQKLMKTLGGLNLPESVRKGMSLVQSVSINIARSKMTLANEEIANIANEEGIPVEEFSNSAFSMMNAVGVIMTVVAAAMSVVYIVLEIMDIIDVVDQSTKMCDELNGRIKESYVKFFGNIQDACKQYKKAIHENGTKKAIAEKGTEKTISENGTEKAIAAKDTQVVPASTDDNSCCVVL